MASCGSLRRKFFVFYVANPTVVSEPCLCVDGFVWVEYTLMWALMIMFFAYFRVFLDHGGIVG
jgi:hypothetical protein